MHFEFALNALLSEPAHGWHRSGDRGFEGNSSSEAETAFDSM